MRGSSRVAPSLFLPSLFLIVVLVFVVGCRSDTTASATDPTATPSPTATPITSATFPGTPTAVSTRPSAVEPYPTRTPLPPTPEPARVVFLEADDFGQPVSGTVFEELLARLPDNEATRSYAKLSDYAGMMELLGIVRPQPGAGDEEIEAFFQELSAVWEDGYVPEVPAWPQALRDYISVTDWFPYLAFDIWSVEQSASAGELLRTGSFSSPPRVYDIAFGQFDPDLTADALAKCDCDQPTIRVHDGVEYFSWGPEFIGEIQRRHGPPMYDHIGRGPRLLIREGEAYYSIPNAGMEDMIDVLQGNEPSLGDDDAYLSAARRLAGLGLMRDMAFFSSGFSLEEALSGSVSQINDPDSFEEDVRKTDLFLPFDTVATGVGFDGERAFTAFVISNPDESTAERNAEIFVERLTTVPISTRSDETYGDQLELIEVGTDGKLVVARLYFRQVERHQFGSPFPLRNSWLIYE